MPAVYAREADSRRGIDDLLRKFKRTVEKNGIPSEIRRREYYEKPTALRKRKMQAAVKRHLKRLAREKMAVMRGRRDVRRPEKERA